MTIRIIAKGDRFAAIVDGNTLRGDWPSRSAALDAVAKAITPKPIIEVLRVA